METVVIVLAAFGAAMLTFFSGFGLGTLLTPVFMLFFPVELAIAATGVVHFCNNIFKLVLAGGKADRDVLLRFGVPAVIFAFIGAWVLGQLPDQAPLFSYGAFGQTMHVYPVKFIISLLLLVFAVMDLMPAFSALQFSRSKLPIGGALSGFFGGLSGNQGALRSAFLIKAGLTRDSFIGTTIVVSTFVDITRLGVYAGRVSSSGLTEQYHLLIFATLAGIAGSFIGNKLVRKVTLVLLKKIVAVMLVLLSLALGAGFI